MSEDRAKLSSAARNALPDSAFAYIDEKGGRHFPIHDKAHVQAALRLGPRSPMWSKAKGKVMAAAKKHGVNSALDNGRSLESLFPEVRYIADAPETRTSEEDNGAMVRHIMGYAAVFNKTSRRLGGFQEQVMPGAFDVSLRSIENNENNVNVVCRYNHKDDMVLGTTMAGTCKLRVDERGLAYDVVPPNHRSDVLELVDRRDVRYSSFAFRLMSSDGDEWGEGEHGLLMRRLHSVELLDVAPVMDPAYHDTNAMARNMTGAVESLANWVGGDPAEVRSMLEAGQAARFFHRSDKKLPLIPKPEKTEETRSEPEALDDPAVSLRTYVPEPEQGDSEVPEDERSIRDWEEIRAALGKPKTTDNLCMRFHHGEPCVRPTGHGPLPNHPADADNPTHHKGLCWGRHDGMPCNQHEGHEGQHTPMTVASRDADTEDTEQREQEPEKPKTLSGPEAMAQMFARKKTLTQLPE